MKKYLYESDANILSEILEAKTMLLSLSTWESAKNKSFISDIEQKVNRIFDLLEPATLFKDNLKDQAKGTLTPLRKTKEGGFYFELHLPNEVVGHRFEFVEKEYHSAKVAWLSAYNQYEPRIRRLLSKED